MNPIDQQHLVKGLWNALCNNSPLSNSANHRTSKLNLRMVLPILETVEKATTFWQVSPTLCQAASVWKDQHVNISNIFVATAPFAATYSKYVFFLAGGRSPMHVISSLACGILGSQTHVAATIELWYSFFSQGTRAPLSNEPKKSRRCIILGHPH